MIYYKILFIGLSLTKYFLYIVHACKIGQDVITCNFLFSKLKITLNKIFINIKIKVNY